MAALRHRRSFLTGFALEWAGLFVIDTWFSRVSVKFVKFADIHPQSRLRWDRCELQLEPHK